MCVNESMTISPVVAEFTFTQSVYSVIEADTDTPVAIELVRGILTFNVDVTVQTTTDGNATGIVH